MAFPTKAADGDNVPYVNWNAGKFWQNRNHRDNRWNSNDRVVLRYSTAFPRDSFHGVFVFCAPFPAVQHPSYFICFFGERYQFFLIDAFQFVECIQHEL